jgi:DnaK suppressor protein
MGQATKLTPQEVEHFSEMLRAEYARLMAMHADSRPDVNAAPPDPGDTADQAEGLSQQTVSLSQAEGDHHRLAQVQRALRKLEEGTYGLSDITEEPIPLERLEAVPWATANVDELAERDEAPGEAHTH